MWIEWPKNTNTHRHDWSESIEWTMIPSPEEFHSLDTELRLLIQEVQRSSHIFPLSSFPDNSVPKVHKIEEYFDLTWIWLVMLLLFISYDNWDTQNVDNFVNHLLAIWWLSIWCVIWYRLLIRKKIKEISRLFDIYNSYLISEQSVDSNNTR